MLAARNVTVQRGPKVILEGVDLSVDAGSRIGVLGRNGAGKSTLLRVLAGLETPVGGTVERAPAALTVGYLTQEVDPAPGETTAAYLRRRTGLARAEAAHDAALAGLERASGPAELAAYDDALAALLALGGDDHDVRVPKVLADLGLPAGVEGRPLAELSGGQQVKVNLAAVLLSRFDVLLLDEPTNNLDFAGLDRLERFLDGLEAGVVLVSHDRAFLDRTVNRIVEFEAETRKVHEYAGTWTEYEAARERGRAQHEAAYADYVDERDRYTALLTRRRGEARAGGAMADRRGTNALRGKVQQAKNHLERLEEVEKPWSPWRLELEFAPAPPTGAVAELRGAVVERGSFRLGPVDLALGFGDRVAVVGRNGAGKTTLIGALTGRLPLTAGERHVGAGAVFGELNQARDLFAGVLLDDFAELSGLEPTAARTLLAKFALGADDVERPAPSLSPGERTRAALALLAARGVNCLILDEPTNHLDLEAIEELETALAGYEGCLLVVTHDRRFLERLAVTRTITL
ncbi:MAG TPA: ABC-F family ATP-binding cassette domain-containing protein [Gaiellaceae bacterium]|nr:ABC-F family ATP-binding cassette domain-containing protein [Gaiellaceae bacterium]